MKKLFVTGLVGTVVTVAVCVLVLVVVLLGGVAKTQVFFWLESTLLPALAIFGGILVVSLFLRRTE